MAGTLVAPYGRQFIFEVYVAKASDGQIAASGDWTIASGDFKVSKDQGTEANPGTLPSFTASSDKVKITLSASEMTGKDIIVKMKDDATVLGDYWRIQTADHPSAAIPNGVIAEGVAQSGGTDKIRLAIAADSPATADLFNGCLLYIYEGTGVGQSRIIVDYSTDRDAFVYVSGGVAEGSQWAVTPDNTSRYRIYALGFMPASMAISGGYVQSDLTTAALTAITTELTNNFIPNLVQARYGAAFTLPFGMVDATDLHTPETGITVTVEVSKDGGAFAAATNAATEIAVGEYSVALTAAEMTASRVLVKLSGTGCKTIVHRILTAPM